MGAAVAGFVARIDRRVQQDLTVHRKPDTARSVVLAMRLYDAPKHRKRNPGAHREYFERLESGLYRTLSNVRPDHEDAMITPDDLVDEITGYLLSTWRAARR